MCNQVVRKVSEALSRLRHRLARWSVAGDSRYDSGVAAPAPNRFRFGLFEVDLAARELTRQGRRVPLQEKPFQTLVFLISHAGQVVTRDDLRHHLWPADTFVQFDDNLNTAIKRVREALGDSAESPRYVETVPRRGYRFLPPVD